MDKEHIYELQANIEQAKKIAIFGHINPDGDCIGAMLWLGRLLEKQGKKVTYIVPNKPSKIFDFIKPIKKLKTSCDYKKYDLLIFVDFSDIKRIGSIAKYNSAYFDTLPLIIIDHHIEWGMKHALMIKDEHSISVCEILFEYTYTLRPEWYDKEVATRFYMGITSDSWNLLFEEDHIRTFTNVLKLLQLWADKDFIVNNLIRKKSLNAIRFLQLLLNRIHQDGWLLYTYYDEKELDEYGVDQEEASYGLHIIQNIDGPEVVLLMRKIWDQIRGSLRSKKTVQQIDCNKLAKTLWWWGHKGAAGFSVIVTQDFEQQIKKLVQQINEHIAQK